MAPKKKQKISPPQARFAALKVVVIDALPFQRKLWSERIGAGFVAVTSPEVLAGALARHADATHVVSCVRGHALVDRVRGDVGDGTHVVTDEWLTTTLRAADGLAREADFAWRAPAAPAPPPPVAAPRRGVLAKYCCQRRITVEGDVNKAVTGALADQMKWWDNGAVNADEFRLYATRIQLLHRVAPIIKSWPVTLTPENWDDEREKLEAQHYISATSTSATGGWIEYIEQLVLGGPAAVVREDCFYKWQRDPVRRVVFEINALKMHVGKKRAVDLVANRGVTSAAELCARRDDPALAIPPHVRPNLALAPVGPSATRMDREETEAILGRFAAAAAEVGLASTAVGSYRRGKVGGHDLDVMLHAPEGAPLVAVADYEFHDGDGAGFRLLERFFARLAAVDVGGAPFLHPHRTMGGLIGAKEAPKLGIRHCFVRSPAVPGAFRQVDFILCPTEIIAHGLLGWSGSTSFQRSLRDYVNHAHEKNWAEVPDRRPIVGRRGWNVTRDGTRVGSLIEGRELDEDEHWAWSQNGIAIARGKHSSKGKDGEQFETTYEECNINLRTEADVFRFFHLDYRAPHERCA